MGGAQLPPPRPSESKYMARSATMGWSLVMSAENSATSRAGMESTLMVTREPAPTA